MCFAPTGAPRDSRDRRSDDGPGTQGAGDRPRTVTNTAPTAQIAAPTADSTFDLGEPVVFSGIVDDAEEPEDALSVLWSSDLDGDLWTDPADATGSTTFTTANLTEGEHQITLLVTDRDGLTGLTALSIAVVGSDEAPTLTIVAPEPDESVREGDTFLLEATVADAETAPEDLIVDVASNLDGALCAPLPDADGDVSCEVDLSAGKHLLTFSVLDEDDHLVSATVYFEVTSGDAHDDDGDGYSEATGDCDDGDDAVRPGATELGNSVDDNCDGETDEGTDRYDADGDCACPGTVCADSVDPLCPAPTPGDCDDADFAVGPDADEIPGDARDQDCDARELCYVDTDGDHFGSALLASSADLDCDDAGEASVSTDCDDTRASVNPGAAEVPADGVDQTCDGVDGCFEDLDGDGFGTNAPRATSDADCTDPGESAYDTDCDDSDSAVFPGAAEGVADGRDQDCDAKELCYVDADKDGSRTAQTVASPDLVCLMGDGEAGPAATIDCDDIAASVHPGATEVIGDEIDQDCDTQELCYVDADKDAFRTGATVVSADRTCATSAGEATAAVNADCNDANAAIKPGVAELPGDQVDQNCDLAELCYVDADKDGARVSGTVASADLTCATSASEAVASAPTDCNDGDAAIKPGATEVVGDEFDQDCDTTELCYVDADNDDYGASTTSSTDIDCDGANEGHLPGECDDTNAAYKPGATDTPGNGVDENCDGSDPVVATCKAILTAVSTAPSGTYTIDPDGSGVLASVRVQCDMAHLGGGWTLVGKYYYGSGTMDLTGAAVGAAPITTAQTTSGRLSDTYVAAIATAGQQQYLVQAGTSHVRKASCDTIYELRTPSAWSTGTNYSSLRCSHDGTNWGAAFDPTGESLNTQSGPGNWELNFCNGPATNGTTSQWVYNGYSMVQGGDLCANGGHTNDADKWLWVR